MSSAQERATGYQQGAQGETQPGAPGQAQADPGRTEAGTAAGRATEARHAAPREDYEPYDASPAATGGMLLAGTLLVLGGMWSFFLGITGVLKGGFYTTTPAAYTFSYSIKSWGWTHVGIGIAVFAVGVCLLLGMAWARYVGVFVAVVSAIWNFLFIPYYPIWSIIVIAIDVFIIWSLLSVGRRRQPV
ncbi:MAG TPA: hypothetical protein VH637_20355 [Streptosporangiaceae bacterium]|jgi:hypothetical protein